MAADRGVAPPPPPFAEGSFVWCRFPFGPPDPSDRPGPIRHIGYVLARLGPTGILLVAYTSSGPWRGGGRPPPGVMVFEASAAEALGQRPFHLDLRCVARLPPTGAWFPEIAAPSGGVVGRARAALRDRILAEMERLAARSPEVIVVRGVR